MRTREQNLNQVQELAGFIPGFIAQTPDLQLDIDNKRWFGFMFSDTALNMADKAIICLAAAAAISSPYGVYFARKYAKSTGWTDEQLYDAVLLARDIRYYTPWMHGKEYDLDQFKQEVDKFTDRLQQLMSQMGEQPPAPTPRPDDVSHDAVVAEINQTFGFAPKWLTDIPEPLMTQDWIEITDWELQSSPLPDRVKNLAGLAAAAAGRCPYCTYFYKKGTAMVGCTEQEVNEAISVARLISQQEAELAGTEYPLDQYKQEQDRVFQAMQRMMAA